MSQLQIMLNNQLLKKTAAQKLHEYLLCIFSRTFHPNFLCLKILFDQAQKSSFLFLVLTLAVFSPSAKIITVIASLIF